MGEAYRGLTIRIGADTSSIERSMNVLNKTARQLQSQFRATSKALRVDNGNLNLQKQQMRLLGQQAETAASRLARLSAAEKQASQQSKNLANYVRNAALKEAQFHNSLVSTNSALQRFYDSYARAKTGNMSGKEFDRAAAQMKKLSHNFNAGKISAEQFAAAIRSTIGDSFATSLGVRSAEEYVEALRKLNAEWHRLNAAETEMKGAADMQRTRGQIELLKAEVRELAAEETKAAAKLRQLGTGEFRAAAVEIQGMDTAIKQLEGDAKVLDQALRIDPNNMQAAIAKYQSLDNTIENLNKKAEQLKTRMRMSDTGTINKITKEYGSTAAAVEKVGNELTEAKAQALQCRSAYDEANVSLRAMMAAADRDPKGIQEAYIHVKQLEREAKSADAAVRVLEHDYDRVNDSHAAREAAIELQQVEAKANAARNALNGVRTSGGKLAQIGASIKTLGYSLSATIGSGAMMMGMYAIQASKDFDAAYRDMRKTVNGTEEQFESLRRSALDFSKTHWTSADQILSIEAIGGQLGIAAENLEKFGEVVSNLDIATNVDTETMAQNLGQLANIMNDMDQDLQNGPGSFEAYSDALVRLGNNSAAQEDKIQNVMMRIASMGTISGMSTPDLLALATATAATGQGAEAAGTAISKTFSNIESAVNGGDAALRKIQECGDLTEDEMEDLIESVEKSQASLKDFAEVAGMSADAFKDAWNNDPTAAFNAFIGGLKRIDEEGGSVDSTLKNLKINSVRQKQTLLGLTQTFDVLNKSLMMSNNAWNGIGDVWGDAGDAAREAQRKAEGFSGQWQQMTNSAKTLGVELTDSLTPAVGFAADAIAALSGGFAGLPDAVKLAVSGAGALTTALGPMSIFIGGMTDGLSSISTALFGNKDAWSKLVRAQKKGGGELLEAAELATLSAGRFDKMGGKIFDAGQKMTKANGQVTKLGNSISKLGMGIASLTPGKLLGVAAGVTAVATVIGIAVDAYAKWDAKCKLVAKANETMADRVAKSFEEINKSVDVSKIASDSYKSYVEFNEKHIEKMAQSNEQLSQSWANTIGKNASIDTYAKKISEIIAECGEDAKISESRFALLKAQIDAYNNAAGSSITATRDESGALRVLNGDVQMTADSFRELAEAKKLANLSEHYGREASEASSSKEDLLAQIQKQKAEFKKVIEGFASDGVVTQEERTAILVHSQALAELNKQYVEAYQREQSALQMQSLLASAEASEAGTLQSLIANHESLRSAFAASQTGCIDFIDVMNRAGISADDFVGKEEALASAITNWDGTTQGLIDSLDDAVIDLDEVQKRMILFSTFQIGDKTFHLRDDGTVSDEEGKVYAFDDIKIGDKTYRITDEGTLVDENGDVVEFTTNVNEIPEEKTVTVIAETEEAQRAIDTLNAAAQDRTVTITYKAEGSASAPTATGGMLPKAKIFAHANGGYFVDKPTVIGRTGNVTHIAGEAGREFVSTHARGGVVLPLTNPYMRPWVKAVAAQMGGGLSTNVTVVLQYDASSNASDLARGVTNILRSKNLMRR